MNTIEHMNQEVLARLRRLGVVKGVRNLKRPQSTPPTQPREPDPIPAEIPPHTIDDEPIPLETLLPGMQIAQTDVGECYVLDTVFPLDYQHGRLWLSDLLALTPQAAALFCRDERLEALDFRDFLFLDTETTGLRGAGTLAFMVGAAFFDGEAFVVRQYFLRDHADEEAMLRLLERLLSKRAALVTFNGRSFDIPLLDSRYLINRLPTDLLSRPHLDLLPPARRLWRLRLPSCALGSLEQNVLGLTRSYEDVPGWMIPGIYNRYLRSGDGRELTRVFYHNRVDLLSMVTLSAHILRQFERSSPDDHPIDLLGLGKWQEELGLIADAERSLRLAAVPEMPTDLYRQALYRLGYLLKRHERRVEAVEVWQQLAYTSFGDVDAHVELAKHFEWHDVNLPMAREWTEQALGLADSASQRIRSQLAHRLARLTRKLEQKGANS